MFLGTDSRILSPSNRYLQFGSLTLLAILVLSLLMLFLYTLYVDIQTRLSSLTLELRAEILQCAKAYVDNRCEPGTRIPAMERRCADWEDCMNREVVVTGKTRVVAETLAEIVNGFVDVISFKTMVRLASPHQSLCIIADVEIRPAAIRSPHFGNYNLWIIRRPLPSLLSSLFPRFLFLSAPSLLPLSTSSTSIWITLSTWTMGRREWKRRREESVGTRSSITAGNDEETVVGRLGSVSRVP